LLKAQLEFVITETFCSAAIRDEVGKFDLRNYTISNKNLMALLNKGGRFFEKIGSRCRAIVHYWQRRFGDFFVVFVG
jgi:hypothetical protein